MINFINKFLYRIIFFLGIGGFIIFFPSLFFYIDQNSIIGHSINNDPSIIKKEYDVLLMGDSRCHQGCDPQEIKKHLPDLKIYNLGRPAMQTPFFYIVLQDYLNTCIKKPKAIVINISFYLLGGQRGFLEDIYLTHYQPKLWQVGDFISEGLINISEGVRWYIGSRFNPFRYKKAAKSFVDSISKLKFRPLLCDFYLYKSLFNPLNLGYYSRGGETFDPFNSDPYSYKSGIYEDKIYLTYLEKFFNIADKAGIKVILYSFPWPKQLEINEHKEILSFYNKLLKEKAKNYSNVHFIEEEYFWEPELFSDQQHLNQKGSNKLAKEISLWLKEYL